MYGCPSWRDLYRKTSVVLRYWIEAWKMFFGGKLGRVGYAPWIPFIEVILLTYVLIGIPTIAILIGSLIISFILFSLIRVSFSRLSHNLWFDWERYLRCSKPIVMLSEKLDKVINSFRSGFIEEGCMGLGLLLMIYFSILIGIAYAIIYPEVSITYTVVMVLGMFISLSLGF